MPGSLRPLAIFRGAEWFWQAESALLYSVRTGQPTFQQVHGVDPFTSYSQHAEAAACFQAAMTSASGHEVAAILAAYDFTGMATIVDVGGATGHSSRPSCRPPPPYRGSCLTALR